MIHTNTQAELTEVRSITVHAFEQALKLFPELWYRMCSLHIMFFI